jgi:hypothetical protein
MYTRRQYQLRPFTNDCNKKLVSRFWLLASCSRSVPHFPQKLPAYLATAIRMLQKTPRPNGTSCSRVASSCPSVRSSSASPTCVPVTLHAPSTWLPITSRACSLHASAANDNPPRSTRPEPRHVLGSIKPRTTGAEGISDLMAAAIGPILRAAGRDLARAPLPLQFQQLLDELRRIELLQPSRLHRNGTSKHPELPPSQPRTSAVGELAIVQHP